MYGGKVAENIAMNGAGVYVNKDGSAAMYGGKITGNKVGEGYGAGVYVGGGTFDMYGGSISGNNQLGWNYNGDGGGVYIQRQLQLRTMARSPAIMAIGAAA